MQIDQIAQLTHGLDAIVIRHQIHHGRQSVRPIQTVQSASTHVQVPYAQMNANVTQRAQRTALQIQRNQVGQKHIQLVDAHHAGGYLDFYLVHCAQVIGAGRPVLFRKTKNQCTRIHGEKTTHLQKHTYQNLVQQWLPGGQGQWFEQRQIDILPEALLGRAVVGRSAAH